MSRSVLLSRLRILCVCERASIHSLANDVTVSESLMTERFRFDMCSLVRSSQQQHSNVDIALVSVRNISISLPCYFHHFYLHLLLQFDFYFITHMFSIIYTVIIFFVSYITQYSFFALSFRCVRLCHRRQIIIPYYHRRRH